MEKAPKKQKATSESGSVSKKNNVQALADRQKAKNPVKQRLFPPLPLVVENEPKVSIGSYEEMDGNDFDSGPDGGLDNICNMISVLPLEYDTITEVTEEGDGLVEEMATHKPLCYYVVDDGSVKEDKEILERPDITMQQRMKHLYLRSKVDGVRVNKVLIDCGSCINVIPHSLLKRIGKYDTDLKSNNMVLSNY